MKKTNWKLVVANALGICFLAYMGAGIFVPIGMFWAVFICNYENPKLIEI